MENLLYFRSGTERFCIFAMKSGMSSKDKEDHPSEWEMLQERPRISPTLLAKARPTLPSGSFLCQMPSSEIHMEDLKGWSGPKSHPTQGSHLP